MNELDNRRGANMLFTAVTKRPRGQQDDQRSQTLAAAHDDVLGHLRDQRNVALEADRDQAVDRAHIVLRQRSDVVEA